MKKKELIAILMSYGDDDDFFVESAGGYEEPTIYVTAVRPRAPDEFVSGQECDYVSARDGKGCIIIGTSHGCSKL